jgi:aspartate carbamoyltransferase catalytic subunit
LAEESDASLKGKIIASLFFVPSMRTRFSFEAAMLRLGGGVLSTETAGVFSSELKGSFEDTVRVVSEIADVIVLRHHDSGYARRAVAVSRVPVINAGDGSAQDPTQALLDLYAIEHHLGGVDGCSIATVGDLYSRSTRSLCYFLPKFHGIHIVGAGQLCMNIGSYLATIEMMDCRFKRGSGPLRLPGSAGKGANRMLPTFIEGTLSLNSS